MNARGRGEVRRRWLVLGVVLLVTVGLTSADVVGTAGSADAYWAARGTLTSGEVSAGRLLTNLTCGLGDLSGGPSGNDDSGVHNIKLAWDSQAPTGTSYAVTVKVTGDSGSNGAGWPMWPQDWDIAGPDVGIDCTMSTNNAECVNGTTIYATGPINTALIDRPTSTTTMTMPGLQQIQFGVGDNILSGGYQGGGVPRTFTGEVSVVATTPDTSGSWTSSSQTYLWTVTYPDRPGEGVTTCTELNPNVDIVVGANEASLNLPGDDPGPWQHTNWTFTDVLPGESYARSITVKNVGTLPVTLSATLSQASALGLNAQVYWAPGAQALATNDTPTQQSTTGAGTVTLRRGTCGGTSTGTASPVTATAAPVLSGVPVGVGNTVTVCVLLSAPSPWTTAQSTQGGAMTMTFTATAVG